MTKADIYLFRALPYTTIILIFSNLTFNIINVFFQA